MRKGETVIWGVAALITAAAAFMGYVVYNAPSKHMPTYQIESVAAQKGELLYRKYSCSACHKIWTLGGSKGGALDGIGSRRDEAWLTDYLSAANPQLILPSTQAVIYRMPSFARMEEEERTHLVAFLFSLRDYVEPEEGDGL